MVKRVVTVKLGRENNPGNARWCDVHGRLECVKNRSSGKGTCHGPAISGLDGCRIHVGVSGTVAVAKGKAEITAWSAMGNPADGRTLDAGVAVLGMLQMTWLRVAAYGELLRQQVAIEALPEPDRDGFDPNGSVQGSGLIGYHYGAAGKEGSIYAVSEEIRALVTLEAQERDRVVRFAKTAHDMGISDRLANLAESWGDVVVTRIMRILEGLDLTPEQEALVPRLVQLHLSQIDVNTTGS